MSWRLAISEGSLDYPIACEARETDALVKFFAERAVAARIQDFGGRGTDEEAYLTVIKEPISSTTGEVRDRAANYTRRVKIKGNCTF